MDRYYSKGLGMFLANDLLFGSKDELMKFPLLFEGEERTRVKDVVSVISGNTDKGFNRSIEVTEQDSFWLKKTNAVETLLELMSNVRVAQQSIEKSVASMDEADLELL